MLLCKNNAHVSSQSWNALPSNVQDKISNFMFWKKHTYLFRYSASRKDTDLVVHGYRGKVNWVNCQLSFTCTPAVWCAKILTLLLSCGSANPQERLDILIHLSCSASPALLSWSYLNLWFRSDDWLAPGYPRDLHYS